MAVTQVGAPAATTYTTTNGANTPAALAWNTGGSAQPRNAGDILVLVVTAAATTSVTAPSAPSGWTAGPATGNTGTTPHAYTAIFWKVAAGSDAVPSITVTTSGTTRCGFTLFELTGAENVLSPVDTTGTYASGSGSSTIASMTVTAGANAAYSGEYAIAAFAREQATAATATYTQGGSWSNFGSDAGTSTRDHNFVDYYATPAQGAAASDAATITSAATSYAAGVLATFAPPHDPGPVLTPSSQPPGVRVTLQLAGQALASVIPQVAVTPPTPAPVYPLTQPVDGYRRLHRPPQGIVRGIAGAALAVSVLGPPVTPLHSPVHAARPLPPAGKVISRAGTFSGTGPGVIIKRRPVTPAARPLPPRGTVISHAGMLGGTGPALTPLTSPVKARQPLPPRGVKHARTGTFSGTGPAVTPLHHPVVPAVRPLPPAGRVITRGGTFAGEGPALTPLKTPVRARQPAPPRGVKHTRAGLLSGTGPALTPLHQPVRTVPVRFPSGRAITLRIVQVTAGPTAGPALYPLHQPVRATLPAPRQRGHAEALNGIYAGEGPAVRAFTTPVRARQPLPPRGRAFGIYRAVAQAPAPTTGPPLGPMHSPARARLPFPVLKGRSFTGSLPPIRTGPQPAPLSQPPGVRVVVLRAGHVQSSPVAPQPFIPTTGPVIPPRAQPWRSPILQGVRGGTARSRTGTFSGIGPRVTPLKTPVRASLPLQPVLTGRAATMSLLVVTLPAPAATPAPPRGVPVRAVLPAPSLRGYARSTAGTYAGEGPAVRALTGPMQARRPLPPRGVRHTRSGVYSGQGPALRALTSPVRSRQPLPPAGRVLGVVRVTAQLPPPVSGPPLYPLHQPIRGRLPLPGPGRAATMSVLEFTPGAVSLAPIPPRAEPWRAVIPAAVRGGNIRSTTGTFSGTGPAITARPAPFRAVLARFPVLTGRALATPRPVTPVTPVTGPPLTPLHQPVRARQPLPRPGWTRSNLGVYSGQGPAPAPLRTPVTIHHPLPPRGRVLGIAHPAPPPAPTTGPPVYPLHQPVRARQPLPPRGRVLGVYQVAVLPPTPTVGPRIPPRGQPWRPVLRPPYLHGIMITFVPPPAPPQPIVTALFGSPHQQWQWAAGGARLVWVSQAGRLAWPDGPSRNQP